MNASIVHSDIDVRLVTWEGRNFKRVARVVPMAFAFRQLGAGYARVQIIDLDTDAIVHEEKIG